jgi:hypothetical protein
MPRQLIAPDGGREERAHIDLIVTIGVRKIERSTARKFACNTLMKREKKIPISGSAQKIAANSTMLQGALQAFVRRPSRRAMNRHIPAVVHAAISAPT